MRQPLLQQLQQNPFQTPRARRGQQAAVVAGQAPPPQVAPRHVCLTSLTCTREHYLPSCVQELPERGAY